MMKSLVLVLVLSLLGIGHSAILKTPASRTSLNVGYVTNGDRLLNRTYIYQPPVANSIQYQDVVYRGNLTTRISAVQVTEVGVTQNATPWIIAGVSAVIMSPFEYSPLEAMDITIGLMFGGDRVVQLLY
ncbi:uncharacterized protein ACR2FA_004542 [Aphomia sociella]